MGWKSYDLDRIAQKLVLNARARDSQSLNQSHKMRMAVAYGLERFWGEHLRLSGKEQQKSDYWKETWDELVAIMKRAGVTIPNDPVNVNDVKQVQAMSEKLWALRLEDQRIAIAVLTQLCDCVVWWTQRYKVGRLVDDSDS
ncbi:hypothetical protein [Leptolyngbya sp. NIES-2104]|uniref:hypothetical protein n=1 Tax=Leptolyngbya sp. NIES-2104 TaxID=1552121 RepID=UPI0006EC6E6D|nr:hypothetical protein [Leptolyngbya sp. NIES-2104]GAP99061.1 hypothetical protein NIES2104_56180 [Leptolyngbya sp. NIES-2104]